VIFTAPHFSRLVIGCNPVAFRDVASGAWYFAAVTFIAVRRVTAGTGDGSFRPDAKLTRAAFFHKNRREQASSQPDGAGFCLLLA